MYNPYLKDWQKTGEHTWKLIRKGQPIATLKQYYDYSGSVKVEVRIPEPNFRIEKSFSVGGLTIDGILEKATNEIYAAMENTVKRLAFLLPDKKGDEDDA